MSKKEHIIEIVRTKSLTDILVTGFVDQSDSNYQFYPMLHQIYFKFEDVTVRFASIGQGSAVEIGVVPEILCEFDIDEGDAFCVSSLSLLLFVAPYHKARARSMEVFYSDSENPEEGVLKCVGFELDLGEYIFLDPCNYFGMQIGCRDKRDAWLRDNVCDGITWHHETWC